MKKITNQEIITAAKKYFENIINSESFVEAFIAGAEWALDAIQENITEVSEKIKEKEFFEKLENISHGDSIYVELNSTLSETKVDIAIKEKAKLIKCNTLKDQNNRPIIKYTFS